MADLITHFSTITDMRKPTQRALRRGKQAIHLVSAWASRNGIVLCQVKVDDKNNEITARPELPKMLEFHGCIIGIDQIGKSDRFNYFRTSRGRFISRQAESRGVI